MIILTKKIDGNSCLKSFNKNKNSSIE